MALQDQLDTARASNSANAPAVVVDLQNQIEQVKADQVDVLQNLQAQGGVAVQAPSLFSNLLLAVAGWPGDRRAGGTGPRRRCRGGCAPGGTSRTSLA